MTNSVGIDELALDRREQACCKKAGFQDAASILCRPTQSLEALVGAEGLQRIRRAAAVKQAPHLKTLSQAVDDESPALTTGDAQVDALLGGGGGGGFIPGFITELVGQSSTGKSQLTLQTAVYAAMGFDADAAHQCQTTTRGKSLVQAVDGFGMRAQSERKSVALVLLNGKGEAGLSTRRLRQICDALVAERWEKGQSLRASRDESSTTTQGQRRRGRFADTEAQRYSLVEAQDIAAEELFSNIHIATPEDAVQLQVLLDDKLPDLVATLGASNRPPLGLILIDDITPLLDEGAESGDASGMRVIARSKVMCEVSDALRRIAIQTQSAVVITNHVVSLFEGHDAILRAIVERMIDGAQLDGEAFESIAEAQRNIPDDHHPAMTLAFQEVLLGGLLVHLHPEKIEHARQLLQQDGAKRNEIVDAVISSTRKASLSLRWVNCINTRIVMTHTIRSAEMTIRRATSVLNPVARTGDSVDFVITSKGIQSIKDGEE